MRKIFIFIVDSEIHRQEFLKSSLHLLAISESKVAEHEVEACLESGCFLHDVLKGSNGVIILTHLHKHDPNVLHDLCSGGIQKSDKSEWMTFMINYIKLWSLHWLLTFYWYCVNETFATQHRNVYLNIFRRYEKTVSKKRYII